MKAGRAGEAVGPHPAVAGNPREAEASPGTVRIGGWQRAFFVAVCALLLVSICGPLLIQPKMPNDHYVYLAHNLVQGKLSVDDLPAAYPDQIKWQGHKYLPMGPLPSVILIPFLPLFEMGLRLVWIGQLLTLFNIWLFYRVLGLSGVVEERRRWALLLFFGGTVYFSMALVGASYFFAHIVTITCLLLAVHETLSKRRPLLIGLFLGLALATRFTALFTLPFFLWLLWRGGDVEPEGSEPGSRASVASLPRFALRAGTLALGIAGPVILLFAYNYLRFGDPLESGYSLALLGVDAAGQARGYGLFSLAHIPKNLFMMLLQGPLPWPNEDAPVLQFPYVWPSPWGMGLIYTSSALIYAFRNLRERLKEPFTQACWLGILFAVAPVITYYGIGYIQFGYRYALDFLPFLLLLAARGFPNPMSKPAKSLVLAGVIVNVWGAMFLILWI